jgi:L-malate glycosyltransferase
VLTVLLATRNRSRVFKLVLESFCRLRPPASGWKLLIVDNGSTDQTPQIIASFTNRLPLRALTEPTLGKNFALNAGLSHAEGDLIVLTDDDVFPHEDWLIQLRNAADAQPDFSIFGGSVLPRWEIPPPSWIQWADHGAAYAVTDPAWNDGPVSPTCIWGPNMAIRSNVFQSNIRFDTSMGPRGPNYLQGGDTEMTRRLHRLGKKAWHVRGAIVEHFVRKEQLTKTWVMQRAIRHGRGEFRLGQAGEITSRKLLLGAPRYLYRELATQGRQMTKSWLTRRREDLFRSHWRFNYIRGQIQEARALSQEKDARTHSGDLVS